MHMTGETICDLLTPLIGKPGSIYMVVSRIGQISFASSESNKLASVSIRPDGLLRIERQTGWTVLDPAKVVAVGWNGDPENTIGQFL
jgi:hypothetical protein